MVPPPRNDSAPSSRRAPSSWRVRRAWRILTKAAGRGDHNAIDAVWQAWLRRPDDERWELLTRWRNRANLAQAVRTAAVDPAAPAPERAALGAFCARHGLEPDEEIQRALFYALTGQHERHRAADPGGSLLAVAYQATGDATRAALRQVMTSRGDLDLIRIVAAQRASAGPVTGSEQEYRAGELARNKDWAGLWRLALGLRLADAIDVAGLIDRHWCPADEQERYLYGRFAAAGPDAARQARALAAGPVAGNAPLTTVRMEMPGLVLTGSFSPDGRRLAVLTSGGLTDLGSVLYELELPHGAVVRQYEYPGQRVSCILHLGDAILAACGPSQRRAEGLDRLVSGRREAHDDFPSPVWDLVAHGDGFAALLGPQWDTSPVPVDHERLLLCDGQAAVRRSVSLKLDDDWAPRRLTAQFGGRMLALSGSRLLRVYDPDRELMILPAMESRHYDSYACFADDRLIVAHARGGLETWSVRGPQLVLLNKLESPRSGLWVSDLVVIPSRGEIAVRMKKVNITRPGKNSSNGSVRYFDATFFRIRPPRSLAGSTGHSLWSAPGGRAHALGGEGFVDVAYVSHPLASLADQPMTGMSPADLSAVAGALRGPDYFPAQRPVLELLRACLEYRFRAEVAIGPATARVRPDDIELSAGDDRSR